MPATTTCVAAFKAGLESAATTAITAALPAVRVTYDYGEPDTWSDDTVLFMRTRSEIVPGAMGSQRNRTETVSCEVHFITRRTTQREADLAAFTMLGAVEHHIRMTDLTLGGIAPDLGCWLVDHEADGATADDDFMTGRVCEVIATFQARVRIQN
jgi:hypothetical protein